jgi:SAM-dependent methyltransferase
MVADFFQITERGGEPATRGQIADMFHRYRWASEFCRKRRVLEVACGTGQGLGMLAAVGQRVVGCDVNAAAVAAARVTYGDRVPLFAAKAEQLPVGGASFDVVLLFEAIYLMDSEAFLRECRRVLIPTGRLLLSTTNKDLFDFVPCRFSRTYYGAPELARLLGSHGFSCEVFGYSRTDSLPLRHRALRPIKALAGRLDLLPKTMRGKSVLRRIIFGRLPRMPRDLSEAAPTSSYQPPVVITCQAPDRVHRSLFVVATKGPE